MEKSEQNEQKSEPPKEICKHCFRDHSKCLICEQPGHAAIDCPEKCSSIVISRPIICKQVHHDCVIWSGDTDHLCWACAKIWSLIHIEARSQRGKICETRCWCRGNHYTSDHQKYNCRYCTPLRLSYMKNDQFKQFDEKYKCEHRLRPPKENVEWLRKFPDCKVDYPDWIL
jgi:hypothetical protein